MMVELLFQLILAMLALCYWLRVIMCVWLLRCVTV